MAITASDIDFVASTIGTSDGGAESATEIISGVQNDLWPNLSDALRSAGGNRSKKFFIKNNSGTETASKPSIWITEFPAGMTVELGIGAPSSDDSTASAGTLTAWTANAKVSLASSAADTRQATIVGLNTSGDPAVELLTLTGASEVLSAGTWSKVWSIYLSALNGSNTVTVKQGTGGTVRGTIPPSVLTTFLWVNPPSKASGIKLSNLIPAAAIPVWCRQTWSAGIAAQRPTRQIVAFEENA